MLLSAVYDDPNNMFKLMAKLKKQINNDDTGGMPIFEIPCDLKNSFPNCTPTTHGEAYCKK